MRKPVFQTGPFALRKKAITFSCRKPFRRTAEKKQKAEQLHQYPFLAGLVTV